MSSNFSVSNHDFKFLFGDLNYRINLTNDKCRKLIAAHDYNELCKFDEFSEIRKNPSSIMNKFTEGSLTFDPTYKYNFNSNDYDTSSK